MKKFSVMSFCLSLFLTFGCGEDSGSGAGGDSNIGGESTLINGGGVVAGSLSIDSDESVEVDGTIVQIVGSPGISALADGDGSFKLENAPAGQLEILAITPSDGGSTLKLSDGQSYGVKIDDVLVVPGQTTDVGEQVMRQTGSLSGKVDFFENPNNIDLTGSEVFIPGTQFIVKTDDQGLFSIAGLPEGKYNLRAQKDGFAVTDLESISVKSGENTELKTILLSLSKGPEGGISVKGDIEDTIAGLQTQIFTTRTVKVDLSYDSDAVLMKYSDEPSFLNKKWENVSQGFSWTFTSDGPKTLYVKYSDLNGLESSPFSVSLFVDTENPTMSTTVLLHNWPKVASHGKAYFDFVGEDAGTGIKKVQYSLDSGSTWSDGNTWADNSKRVSLTLPGAGSHTVSVRVMDFTNKFSNVVSDSIIVDTTTVVSNQSYTSPITLYKEQSPFSADTAQFDSDLEIEPGVSFTVTTMLNVKGKFIAKGTSTEGITLGTPGVCGVTDLVLDQGDSGVSEKSVVSYVTMENLVSVNLNGGAFSNNLIRSPTCGSPHTIINRNSGKFDKLVFDDNEVLDSLLVELTSTENIEITNNEITTAGLNIHDDKTEFGGNAWNLTGSEGVKIYVTNSAIDFKEDSFSSTGSVFYTPTTLSRNIIVHNANVTSCATLVFVGDDDTWNFEGLNLQGSCTVFRWDSVTTVGTVNIIDSTLDLDVNMVSPGGDQNITAFSIANSDITLSNAMGVVDFLNKYVDTGYNLSTSFSFSMTGNNINCNGDGTNGCRGFVIERSSDTNITGTVTLDLSGNYWGGGDKALVDGSSILEPLTTSITPSVTEVPFYRLSTSGITNTTFTSLSADTFSNAASPIAGTGAD